MPTAHWLDLGTVAPARFHAFYPALAGGASPTDPPRVLWARVAAHVCVGSHQNPALELDPACPAPVVRRPLGGGTVWVDEHQLSWVLIAPLALAPRRPQDWFAWALAPAVATYRAFGLAVERHDCDLWLGGKKIAGSGAATLGACAVVASSFLLRFPAAAFAACVASPSPGFRQWLTAALREGVTDWESAAPPPPETDVQATFAAALAATLGWAVDPCAGLGQGAPFASDPGPDDDGWAPATTRLVPCGVKINADTYLCERHYDAGWVRVLSRAGRLVRLALSLPLDPACLRALVECVPTHQALAGVLSARLPGSDAGLWADRILQTAHFGG